MFHKTIKIANVDFQEWQQAFTAITGFDDPDYWKILLKNPDFDKKGLFKASIKSKERMIIAGLICTHSSASQALINNLFINEKELTNDSLDRVASELILSAINRLKKLGKTEIVTRIKPKDPNKIYYERNNFITVRERVHLSKRINSDVISKLKSVKKKQQIDLDILRLSNEDQISKFVKLNQLIFKEDGTEPLTEKEIKDWLVTDPSFGLDQMFIATVKKTGEKAGIGHCYYYPTEKRGGIFGIGVMEKYRGRGVASKLINAITDYIRGKGGKIAYIECYKDTEAEKIYKHLGFTIDSIDAIMAWKGNEEK
ncbi:MAG: GNAT family N-acetyltransferase [Candidatus Hodarchaeales archaeon]|jgi:GNAT superfamily N-acetyltransferase